MSVWAAFDKIAAWNKFWLIVGAMLLFYSFYNWAVSGGTTAQKYQAWLLGALGALISVYLLVTNDWDAYPSKIGLITSVGRAVNSVVPELPLESFHPNVMAGAIAVLLPFSGAAAVISWYENNRPHLIAALLLFLTTIVGLLMAGARGAWAAVILAGGLVIWWLAIRRLVNSRRRRRSVLFGSLALALLAGFLLIAMVPEIVSKGMSALPAMESGLIRADLYRNSLALINDYPFIGAGLDNFMMLYSTYALLLHVGFSTHAHNLFMDLTIQQGVLAVFIYLWMLLLMGEAVWSMLANRRRRRRKNGQANSSRVERAADRRASAVVLAAAALSVFILVVHGLVDDSIYGTRMVLLMFVPFAFAAPRLIRAGSPEVKQQLLVVGFGLAIVLLVGMFVWRPVSSLARSNWGAVQQSKAELSIYSWPEWPLQDAVRYEVDLYAAEEGFERAIGVNPGNTSAQRRLGQMKLSLGEYDEALERLEAAYAQTPRDNATKQLLGEAYLVTGNTGAGEKLWSKVDNDLGQLDLRAAWYKHLGDEELYAVVKNAADKY